MPQNKLKRDAHFTGGGQIQGFPGYRIQADRSGLDYFDSIAEEAHMEGKFFRHLFTLKLRTHNPFYLTLMAIFGVIPFLILIVLILGDNGLHLNFNTNPINILIGLFSLGLIFGTPTALAINFTLSLLEIYHVIPSRMAQAVPETLPRRKKKPLKRRKDFR